MNKILFMTVIACITFSSCATTKVYYFSESYLKRNGIEQDFKLSDLDTIHLDYFTIRNNHRIDFPEDYIFFYMTLVYRDIPFNPYAFINPYSRDPFMLNVVFGATSDKDIDYIEINGYRIIFLGIDKAYENKQFNYLILNDFDKQSRDKLKNRCREVIILRDHYSLLKRNSDLKIFNNVEYIEITFDVTYSVDGIVNRRDISAKYFPRLEKVTVYPFV